jgi:hypothetical protein
MQRLVQRCSPRSVVYSLVLAIIGACSPNDTEAVAPLEGDKKQQKQEHIEDVKLE